MCDNSFNYLSEPEFEPGPEFDAWLEQIVASLPEEIRNAPLEDLVDYGPRVGDVRFDNIASIVGAAAAQTEVSE